MRLISKVLIGVLALSLSACEMKLKHAQTPPAPQPAAASKPAPPAEPASSEPLSIPQTQVRLPRPQPIDPEALAVPPVNPRTDAHHAAQKAGRRPSPTAGPATSPTKPDAVETAEGPPPPAAATETRPRIEPLLPADQRRQLNEDISARLHDVDQLLVRITAQRLTNSQKNSVERIRSFSAQSHQALERGDTQQAGALADRALLLAQEMVRAR